MDTCLFLGENEYISFQLKSGVLYSIYKEGLKIDLDIAKKIVDFRLSLTKDNSYPTIIFPNRVKYVDKDARNYFFTDRGSEGFDAIAVMSKDKIINMILSFVFFYSPPIKPTKLFTEEKEALMWLQQFKKI